MNFGVCVYCGESFMGAAKRQKYCRPLCRYRSQEGSKRQGPSVISPKKSIYKGVSYLGNSINKETNRKLWSCRYKKKCYGSFDTENQAALRYNEVCGEYINIINDEPSRNQINLEYFNEKYYEFFWLSTRQIIEILECQINKENQQDHLLLIEYLNGNKSKGASLLNKYMKRWRGVLRYSGILKIKPKNNHIGMSSSIDDAILSGFMTALELVKKGKFNGRNFVYWATEVMRIKYIDDAKKSNLKNSPDVVFRNKKIIEHEEEMKLLYA